MKEEVKEQRTRYSTIDPELDKYNDVRSKKYERAVENLLKIEMPKQWMTEQSERKFEEWRKSMGHVPSKQP